MVASPPIMLLDEFTAGLDAWNEQVVTEALVNKRPAGQTVVAVAQTLSTVRAADKIIFVGSDGTIKEQGTWEELVALGGGFAEFVKIQGLSGSDGGGGSGDGEDGSVDADAAGDTEKGNGGQSVSKTSSQASSRKTSQAGDAGGGGDEDAKQDGGDDVVFKDSAVLPASINVSALARWKSAGIKLRSLHMLATPSSPSTHLPEHDPRSKSEEVRLTIKQLVAYARDDNLPPHQMALLVKSCDAVLHTVKINDTLRPVTHR